mmetsp:Transcript_16664/g.42968  ORF Transcript_16664/g.42968 Transcript_16664/m.42968 type:complete len:239 (-) Transcript_16664:205-921(-)
MNLARQHFNTFSHRLRVLPRWLKVHPVSPSRNLKDSKVFSLIKVRKRIKCKVIFSGPSRLAVSIGVRGNSATMTERTSAKSSENSWTSSPQRNRIIATLTRRPFRRFARPIISEVSHSATSFALSENAASANVPRNWRAGLRVFSAHWTDAYRCVVVFDIPAMTSRLAASLNEPRGPSHGSGANCIEKVAGTAEATPVIRATMLKSIASHVRQRFIWWTISSSWHASAVVGSDVTMAG